MRAERCRVRKVRRESEAPDPAAISPLEDLRYIRQTMESAAQFTAVSGWGMVVVGAIAMTAAAVAEMQSDALRWTGVWMIAAVVAASVSVAANAQKSLRSGRPPSKAVLRKFLLAFLPPLFTGAVLTALLIRAEQHDIVPAMWLLMYGTAVVSGGVFSVRLVPAMGLGFIAAGLLALVTPAAAVNWLMAAAFGGLHLIFGAMIARRHGG